MEYSCCQYNVTEWPTHVHWVTCLVSVLDQWHQEEELQNRAGKSEYAG